MGLANLKTLVSNDHGQISRTSRTQPYLFISYLCYPLIITSQGGLALSRYHRLGLVKINACAPR